MKYTAKTPDKNGWVDYSADENKVWQTLYQRQIKTVQGRASEAFLDGIKLLGLPHDRVPQLNDVSEVLTKLTGWSVFPVPALISTHEFFTLLANRQFPAATFIRVMEELDYLEEPDIFHEFFGHCPMLTHPVFADFMQRYGEITLKMSAEDQELMARLFWFTVEFGLIQEQGKAVCYGGGILSSHGETEYAVDSEAPQRKAFDLVELLRTPYRIDIMQPIYFVINDYKELYDLLDENLTDKLAEVRALGEFKPVFEVKDDNHDNEEWVTC